MAVIKCEDCGTEYHRGNYAACPDCGCAVGTQVNADVAAAFLSSVGVTPSAPDNRPKRPISLLLISLYLLIGGIVTPFITLASPGAKHMTLGWWPWAESAGVALLVLFFLNAAIGAITAYCVLFGKIWGRTLYVVWEGLLNTLSLVAHGVSIPPILSFFLYFIIIYFLYTKKANRFFDSRSHAWLDE